MSAVLEVVDLTYVVNPQLSLRIGRFELHPGQFHVLLGANGAGKSTLLSLLSGQRKPNSGLVKLFDRDVAVLQSKEQARSRAVLTQEHGAVFSFSSEEIVAMGRYPWAGTEREQEDQAVITAVMDHYQLHPLAQRPVDVLSGGEKARVAMGRITAQATSVMLLDEPTAALDLKHQLSLLQSVKSFTQEGGSALVIVHDINRALEFADMVSFLHDGRIIASGVPLNTVTPEIIEKTYGVAVDVRRHPVTGNLSVTPLL